MAENEVDSLQILNERVGQLEQLCTCLKKERDEALNRQGEMKADLVNAELRIKALERQNNILQSMQIGGTSVLAAKQNKAQLSKLVRELDRCIALLNA